MMKKLLGIVVLGLLLSGNAGFAKSTKAKILERYEIKIKAMHSETVVIVCMDGYKFIHTGGTERNLVQFYEERDGKSLPAKC